MISDDSLLTMVPSLVPQHRDRDAPGVARLCRGVDLVQELRVMDGIGNDPGAFREGPAVLRHEPVHDRFRDHGLQSLERAHDPHAVYPGASQTDIEMVPARLRLKSPFAVRAGRSVGGDPVAELALAANEAAAARLGIIPNVLPLAIDQQSHLRFLVAVRLGKCLELSYSAESE
jgi:hypothetical protein